MLNLTLIVPQKDDLWFKKEIKEDPSTMDYNAGYDLNFSGYNRENGTIQTNLQELEDVWSKHWIGNEPTNFYYYTKNNNEFVGEIYAKFDAQLNAHEIGIVIKAEHRRKGIATPAINLLCQKLKEYGIKKLYHELPSSRHAAIKADINNGFILIKDNIDGIKKFGKIEKLVYLEKTL